MSQFAKSADQKISSAGTKNTLTPALKSSAVDGVKAVLEFAQELPYVGAVAKLLNGVITLCEQRKCNKEAFDQLKIRLYRFTELLLGKDGLAAIAEKRSENEILVKFTKRMEDILDEGIQTLGTFTKAGFLSSVLSGSKPKQHFDDLDKELTICLNELSVALQAAQMIEHAQTYNVVCDIQDKINQHGGLEGVNKDPKLLKYFADEIGANVEDLKEEVVDSLSRIENTVNHVDENVKATKNEVVALTTTTTKTTSKNQEQVPNPSSEPTMILTDIPEKQTKLPVKPPKPDKPSNPTTHAAAIEKQYLLARYGDASACSGLIGSADNNHLIAAAYVSILYDTGCKHIPINKDKAAYYADKAMPWIRTEASRGNPYAQYHLGDCYRDGRGVAQSHEEAVKYFFAAAKQSHAGAQTSLGEILIGVLH